MEPNETKEFNIFDELLQYRLSTDNVNIIRKYCDELTSIKIGNENLKELLESSNTEDEKTGGITKVGLGWAPPNHRRFLQNEFFWQDHENTVCSYLYLSQFIFR